MHGIFLNKNLVFIDIMQFINSSLKKLVKNLLGDDFKYLTEEFGSENLELIKQRDVYPYDYMNSFKRFNEEKLSHEKCFYNSKKHGTTGDDGEKLDSDISNEDYLMCKKVWKEFNMKYISDYQDHYLEKGVLLLADVFEKFIETCLKFYGLDPYLYFSSFGFGWVAMLKTTGVKLEKIVDIDMYLFIEKGPRGISYKQITNTAKIMTLKNCQNTYCTLI